MSDAAVPDPSPETGLDDRGIFDARYLAFLGTIPQIRPKLLRYCARMTGSVLDGEDVVQDALFDAYRKLETFDDARPLGPWLFRIAHNRCIDLLRRRGVREGAEAEAAVPDAVAPVDPPGPALGRAVEHLVLGLPPMERACVLLKDVFDYSLEDIAPLVDSTVGGVKAALSRGRGKLAAAPARRPARRPKTPEIEQLLRLYVERFNQQDWDGLRTLIAADARLRVADAFSGPLSASPYFSKWAAVRVPWRMAAGEVDGEPAVIILQRLDDRWTPKSAVMLELSGGVVARIADFGHITWLLDAADSVVLW
jgi:RNA polymerase sigma-70 factor (ECF subfamily)